MAGTVTHSRNAQPPASHAGSAGADITVADGASLGETVGRVVSSSQRLLLDHLELIRFDTRMLAADTLRASAILVAGAVLGLLGWLGAMIALVGALAASLDYRAATAIVAGAHLVAGGVLALAGRHAWRSSRSRQRFGEPEAPGEH